MNLPVIFRSKVFLIAVLALLIFVGSLELKQWEERRSVNREIANLQAQEQDLQQKNRDLENSLNFLTSDEYREKIARQQLNLKKDGEIVVNFPKDNLSGTAETAATHNKSNPRKWWDYFFALN
jgi:cell division protein FtsL